MKTNQYNWTTSDGLKLFAKSWIPDQNIKGVITWVHGMGEYIERYEHVAKFLTDAGYAIVGYDHRGHGKSDGGRGHIPNYEQFLDDVTLALNKSKELVPNVPQFIFGHSMGGGLVANYLIHRQPKVNAAILSAPYFRLTNPQPPLKLALGRMTQNLIPKLTLPTGLNANHISRDPKEVEKYIQDPMIHDKVSAKMGIAIVDAGESAIANANKVKVETLIVHGSGDQLTDSNGSVAFAKNAGSEVHIKLMNGWYHELHNEPEKQEVLDLYLQWLDSHL